MAECSVSRDAAAECERTESGTVSGAQKPALSLDNAPLCGSVCLFEADLVLLVEGSEFTF